jgi:hypothetical protein
MEKGKKEDLPVAGFTWIAASRAAARLLNRVYGILHLDPSRPILTSCPIQWNSAKRLNNK